MESWGYLVLVSYAIPIGIGLALLFQKRLPFVGVMLWSYVLLTVCVEISGAFLAYNGINNLWIYRFYLYGELVFPLLFFYNQFSRKQSKVCLMAVFVVSMILITLTNFFDDWQDYASIQTGITFGCIAYIIISYFVEMFRMEKVFNPFRDVYFIVGAILFIGHSCTLFYDIVFDYLITGYFGDQVHSILNGVNMGLVVLYNVLYSYALWLSKLRPI